MQASRTTRATSAGSSRTIADPITVWPPPVSSSRIAAPPVSVSGVLVSDTVRTKQPTALRRRGLVLVRRGRRALAHDGFSPAVRAVENLDQVQHGQIEAAVAKPGLDLQNAAGVGGDHRLRPRGFDVAHLAPQQAIGHLRLREVVDAGRAAAPVGLRQVDHAQPGHLSQQRARLPANLLAVHDVTGIVIRHRHRDRAQRTAQRLAREELGHVLDGAPRSAAARAAHAGSFASSAPKAFMCAPQPEVLTITASARAASKVSIVCLAIATARA